VEIDSNVFWGLLLQWQHFEPKKNNAGCTSSRLRIIAFAASYYIDSSTMRLAALHIWLFETKYIALS